MVVLVAGVSRFVSRAVSARDRAWEGPTRQPTSRADCAGVGVDVGSAEVDVGRLMRIPVMVRTLAPHDYDFLFRLRPDLGRVAVSGCGQPGARRVGVVEVVGVRLQDDAGSDGLVQQLLDVGRVTLVGDVDPRAAISWMPSLLTSSVTLAAEARMTTPPTIVTLRPDVFEISRPWRRRASPRRPTACASPRPSTRGRPRPSASACRRCLAARCPRRSCCSAAAPRAPRCRRCCTTGPDDAARPISSLDAQTARLRLAVAELS